MSINTKLETHLAIAAIIAIVVAWFLGRTTENADTLSAIKTNMPKIDQLEEIDNFTYKMYNIEGQMYGYLTLESSMGYGGPLQMAIAVDSTGKIFDLAVISSKETPSYLKKVLDAQFLDKIKGRTYNDSYSIGKEIDAVSSATYSSRDIVEASKKGNRFIAAQVLNKEVPASPKTPIHFGCLELTIILLYIIAYFAHKKSFKFTKQARWFTMIIGLLVLGFSFKQPITLSMINQLLLGYFPPLNSNVIKLRLIYCKCSIR